MHRSSCRISALAGPFADGPEPSISSMGMIRMQFSGQMSTQPPHRMQSSGWSQMLRKH
jgi:hypothetical protein